MHDPNCLKIEQDSGSHHSLFPEVPVEFPPFFLPPLLFPPFFDVEATSENFQNFMSYFPLDPSLLAIMQPPYFEDAPAEDKEEEFKVLRPVAILSHTKQIGPITIEERRVKVNKFLEKRKRRNFAKRVSYACRKRVADDRLRVKGRFIKKIEAEKLVEAQTSEVTLIDRSNN